MTVTKEISIKTFPFWSGAASNRAKLTDEECDRLEQFIEELGEEPTIAGDLSNYIDAVALSEQNAGICIYPMTTYNVSDLIVTKIITESARQVEYALVWKRNDRQTELQEEFINYVQDCMEEERRGTQPYIMPEREYFPPEDTKYL